MDGQKSKLSVLTLRMKKSSYAGELFYRPLVLELGQLQKGRGTVRRAQVIASLKRRGKESEGRALEKGEADLGEKRRQAICGMIVEKKKVGDEERI